MEEIIFWKDYFKGKAQGGYFIRNSLKEFVEKLESKGLEVVGIRYNGSYNLECLVVEKQNENAKN